MAKSKKTEEKEEKKDLQEEYDELLEELALKDEEISSLKEDLETIYDANIEANNKAVAMQEYYDLEQNKVYNAISRLSLRVENTP